MGPQVQWRKYSKGTLERLRSNLSLSRSFGDLNLENYKIVSTVNGDYMAKAKDLSFDNFEFVSYIGESKHPRTKKEYTHFGCSLKGEVIIVNAVKL